MSDEKKDLDEFGLLERRSVSHEDELLANVDLVFDTANPKLKITLGATEHFIDKSAITWAFAMKSHVAGAEETFSIPRGSRRPLTSEEIESLTRPSVVVDSNSKVIGHVVSHEAVEMFADGAAAEFDFQNSLLNNSIDATDLWPKKK